MTEKMNISVAEYSRIETGLEKPEKNILSQLASIFGLSTEEFLNDRIIV